MPRTYIATVEITDLTGGSVAAAGNTIPYLTRLEMRGMIEGASQQYSPIRVVEMVLKETPPTEAKTPYELLTQKWPELRLRDMDVIMESREGGLTKHVAHNTGMGVQNVKSRLARCYKVMGVHNRAQMALAVAEVLENA